MEGTLNEILNFPLLSVVLGILKLNCEEFVGHSIADFFKTS